jgi:hypothetical protein
MAATSTFMRLLGVESPEANPLKVNLPLDKGGPKFKKEAQWLELLCNGTMVQWYND